MGSIPDGRVLCITGSTYEPVSHVQVQELKPPSRAFRRHVMEHAFADPPRREMTAEEKWNYRREREFNLIRSHKTRNCYKQLAVFAKWEDGTKMLVALVDYHKKGKKLFGGTISPVFWWNVSTNYHVSFGGLVDFRLTEENLCSALGLEVGEAHVYAQSLDEVRKPRDTRERLRYERFPQKRYMPGVYI